jgi:hypothetical protein
MASHTLVRSFSSSPLPGRTVQSLNAALEGKNGEISWLEALRAKYRKPQDAFV